MLEPDRASGINLRDLIQMELTAEEKIKYTEIEVRAQKWFPDMIAIRRAIMYAIVQAVCQDADDFKTK